MLIAHSSFSPLFQGAGVIMGSKSGNFTDNSVNEQHSDNPGFDETLNYVNLFNYKDQSEDLSSLNLPSPSADPTQYDSGSYSKVGQGLGVEVSEDNDSDSDNVLKYISEILMEEDMDQKPCMFHESLSLQVSQRQFSDAVGTNDPIISGFVDSSGGHSLISANGLSTSEGHDSLFDQTAPVESYSQHSQTLFGSGSVLDSTSFGLPAENNVFTEDLMMQFQKGMEEASKFLPKSNNIVIDIENMDFPDETEDAAIPLVKNEEDEFAPDGSVGTKIHSREEDEFDEDRSNKQSAVSTEEAELSDMFDRVLLCQPTEQEGTCTMRFDSKEGSGQTPGPSKLDDSKNQAVDLRTLLILCAESIASDDRRTSDELLKQIRKHSSSDGDGSQRLAYYFGNALEARLAGTGAQIYTSLSSKRTTAADMIKAYQLFYCICPFKRISIGFANHSILKAVENKSKLHIIDFGILYGFQWPLLIQGLSERPGGPPKLCITGIDLPQPGFRPSERVETTGVRLANYCRKFNVPFEYHAIAQRWETITLEDLKLENDGIIIVNCLFRFKNLLDETIMVDSPRNAVLNLVRRIKPDIFLHGVVNGSYNSPFFVTRFREALFHYSTLFDMFEANASRKDPERVLFEKELYGREIMNVVACEGTERVERPETYKQWQTRNIRVGFRQHCLDLEVLAKLRSKAKGNYHRDFVIDVDGQWILLGWKGRIIHAISAWVPA
ncbi:scarecrow-like protein 14 [Silene latifolia]|uniref:scarecrow-like protein 14 n=1 Tax=Silene latifolia TaxID=37657 RepID=UPI003D776AFD